MASEDEVGRLRAEVELLRAALTEALDGWADTCDDEHASHSDAWRNIARLRELAGTARQPTREERLAASGFEPPGEGGYTAGDALGLPRDDGAEVERLCAELAEALEALDVAGDALTRLGFAKPR